MCQNGRDLQKKCTQNTRLVENSDRACAFTCLQRPRSRETMVRVTRLQVNPHRGLLFCCLLRLRVSVLQRLSAIKVHLELESLCFHSREGVKVTHSQP